MKSTSGFFHSVCSQNPALYIDTQTTEKRDLCNWESGEKVYIGNDLPSEYKQLEYTKQITKNKNKLDVKKEAAQNFKDIIEIASDRKWE